MLWCKLCKSEYVFTTYLCENCSRIKHIMNIYGNKRVLEVIESVLIRNTDQQNHKVKTEVSKIVKEVK